MIDALPHLTEAQARAYFYETYFERGIGYYNRGYIFDTIRRENHLEARCHGSMAHPYRVMIELGENGIQWDDCSCPIGGGCKHVAALALTWVHQPEVFAFKETVLGQLEDRSKNELIALIAEMLKREPNLEVLLDLPSLREHKSDEPIDPEPYRRQVRNAFLGAEDWETHYTVAPAISSVVDMGDKFLDAQDYHNASTIYQVVVEEGTANYEHAYHDEGEIGWEIDRAVDGLVACLDALSDESERRRLLEHLFAALAWNIGIGGYGLADQVPEVLVTQTTPDEREQIRAWINVEASKTVDSHSNWRREHWGRIMLELYEPDARVDEFLERAAALGMHETRFNKLVELKRIDEAVAVADAHLRYSDWEFLRSAQTLEKAGCAEQAVAMVAAHLKNISDDRLLAWLAEQYERRNSDSDALELHLRRWQERPSETLYKALERLGKSLGRWGDLRTELITGLQDAESWGVLASVYLHDEDWDAAWDVAEKGSKTRWGGWHHAVLERVAHATEAQRPHKAIRYYLMRVQQLADQRGRKNYAAAAEYLLRVRQISKDLHQMQAWEKTLAEVRATNDNLPAFQDELNKAGL